MWQSAGARLRLTAKVHVTSLTYTSPLESTARPCGAAKLPGAVASGVPMRDSSLPSRSNTDRRACMALVMGPCVNE